MEFDANGIPFLSSISSSSVVLGSPDVTTTLFRVASNFVTRTPEVVLCGEAIAIAVPLPAVFEGDWIPPAPGEMRAANRMGLKIDLKIELVQEEVAVFFVLTTGSG